MAQTIIFDFENSILERENVDAESITDLVKKYGLDVDETMKKFISYMHGDLERNDFLSSPHMEEVERAFLDAIKIRDDVKERIKSLSETKTLALFSSLPTEWFWYIVKKNDIENYFDYIILSNAVGVQRKSKDVSKILRSGIPSDDCVFVSSDDEMRNYVDYDFVHYDKNFWRD